MPDSPLIRSTLVAPKLVEPIQTSSVAAGPVLDALLLESGDYLLFESAADHLLLE